MARYSLGVAVLLAVAAVARPQDEASKKDLRAMEGAWSVVVHEADGKKTTPEEARMAESKLVVKDGKYTVVLGDRQRTTGTIRLDAGKSPKQIDAIAADGPYKDQAMPGIYEIKEDEMRICFAQPGKERPKQFSTAAGTGQILLGYKRAKQ
ncbi:MAG: TIGR03067 domain-containing protein [Gemmataceae bacterium]|nr:TIGR03067 domain-containing protein [Gemmataceae bacterium]